jgi:hypothetical protein
MMCMSVCEHTHVFLLEAFEASPRALACCSHCINRIGNFETE